MMNPASSPPPDTLDTVRLRDWLAPRMDGVGPDLTLTRFTGGQSNPTYLLETGARKFVLRRKPGGKLLPSAHAIDREFRVISALSQTEVPVARPHLLCEDDSIIGSAFYVMDHVEGRVFWDAALPDLAPAERGAIYAEMSRVLAALHAVDYKAVGLESYGKAGEYVQRQIARWTSQYRASATEHVPAMENLMAWLPEHIPAGDETAIIHGDCRIDNMIFHPTEPRVLAILDWELSTLGHPLADFAYHCLVYRMPRALFTGLAGLDLASLGLPDEAGHRGDYFRRAGRAELSAETWNFYIIFNLFRLAGIAQGVMARALQGNAASADALEMGSRARPLAELGWRQVEILENGKGR